MMVWNAIRVTCQCPSHGPVTVVTEGLGVRVLGVIAGADLESCDEVCCMSATLMNGLRSALSFAQPLATYSAMLCQLFQVKFHGSCVFHVQFCVILHAIFCSTKKMQQLNWYLLS